MSEMSLSKKNLVNKLKNYNNNVYNNVMNTARDDSKFEKMVQAMTVDIAVGKSSLAKNKYRW